MSLAYRAVNWDRQKKRYDLVLAGLVLLALLSFGVGTTIAVPSATAETILIRSTAFTALLLLHLILIIGPLSRLDARFNPLLYNRRHLGVSMFFLALIHAVLVILVYNAGGDANPLSSALTAYARDYALFRGGGGLAQFPFEIFGFLALLIFSLMAATSHDFWLKNLGASFWKALHFGVYLAYGLVLLHVALGFLQTERSIVYPILLGLGFVVVVGLQLWTGLREARRLPASGAADPEGYLRTCDVADLREGRAVTVSLGPDRAAVWLHQGKVFATSNVCRHQGGPLGEGRIVDGCVTCPWHGWNYRLESGISPPPFDEVIPTYDVRLHDGAVYLKPEPNALRSTCPGQPREACDG